MKKNIIASSMLFAILGCNNEQTTAPVPTQNAAARNTNGGIGDPIGNYYEIQTNAQSAVEVFSDCALGEVAVGFGARVYKNNFTGVTTHCRPISATTGALGSQSNRQKGSGGEEISINLPDGMVSIGIGATVTGC